MVESIEDMAKKLRSKKLLKEKLDIDIKILEKLLDEKLEVLDIKRKVITIDRPYPAYIDPYPLTNPLYPTWITPSQPTGTFTSTSNDQFYTV